MHDSSRPVAAIVNDCTVFLAVSVGDDHAKHRACLLLLASVATDSAAQIERRRIAAENMEVLYDCESGRVSVIE